ncbi:MAG TPA: lytic murein transglycosylase B, partial [Pseudomonas sp.]|nr:lytic murein transglycosylase B [Pseudomonas sp.]
MTRTLRMLGLVGVFAGAQSAVAGDYQSPAVDQFIDEMTQEYGFAA